MPTKKLAAIECLASEKSITDAARCAGVTRATIHAWLRDPTFSDALHDHISEIILQSRLYAIQRNEKAFETIDDVLRRTQTEPAAALRAAMYVIDLNTELHEKVVDGRKMDEILQLLRIVKKGIDL